ncbi:hypothetical protein [Lactococcus garvieae]|uniref:Uncharacterized protein n=1 Tax=Lactococcus garvieae TaxID=1363 RepID=A0AA46TUV0_9LACT|nr:hypothetical protein [Lactococcus garvieae]UYT09981.1 hypothetical protein OF801_08375 [Lactococcus garvieae]UYT11953.1 hypothetical protein OF800_08025 [Lactococcus garvieae]
MTPEKKRKLRNIALLSLLGLIGGTMAFQAFNQQAINDRENTVQVNVGGRVHDYYNRDTENKDVFVENYGERPIMARIRLSEFLEYQRGDEDFTPLVPGSERDNLATWITWIPSANNINQRANTGNSNAFNRYAQLTFGWSREGETAPWYMPTFNHDNLDLRTAAAGHARDYIAGAGATDGTTDGTTHPGDGTDAYWSSGDTFDNSAGIWPGATLEDEAAQNLRQQRAPMTIEQWSNLADWQQVGDFWVVDHTTGWAYWASLLEPGNASSYLLDAAELTDAIEDTVFNGSYYYGIHVDSQLISPDNSEEFLPGGDSRLEAFLTGIKNNSMIDEGNPRPDIDLPPSSFDFSDMVPGRVFTMAGEQYRYLEDMGNGNHMITCHDVIYNTSFNMQPQVLSDWFNGLDAAVQSIVQPVLIPVPVPNIAESSLIMMGQGAQNNWLPTNLSSFPAVAGDVTTVNPSGTPQAFSLSLADVVRLSTPEGPFPNIRARSALHGRGWFLRTPGPSTIIWSISVVNPGGLAFAHPNTETLSHHVGVRPTLIVHQ